MVVIHMAKLDDDDNMDLRRLMDYVNMAGAFFLGSAS